VHRPDIPNRKHVGTNRQKLADTTLSLALLRRLLFHQGQPRFCLGIREAGCRLSASPMSAMASASVLAPMPKARSTILGSPIDSIRSSPCQGSVSPRWRFMWRIDKNATCSVLVERLWTGADKPVIGEPFSGECLLNLGVVRVADPKCWTPS
jgi:hypothetical protein